MNRSGKLIMLAILLMTDFAGKCQTTGYNLGLKDNTGRLDNLKRKASDFFKNHPAPGGMTSDIVEDWDFWDKKEIELLARHFKPTHPYIIRLKFDPANDIDDEAIKLTFTSYNLVARESADVDVLYIRNDEQVLIDNILPLVLEHIGHVVLPRAKKPATIVIHPNEELNKGCLRFRDILIRIFIDEMLLRSFFVVGSGGGHDKEIFGTPQSKHGIKLVEFTYRGADKDEKPPKLIAACDCKMISIEDKLIDFIKKIAKP